MVVELAVIASNTSSCPVSLTGLCYQSRPPGALPPLRLGPATAEFRQLSGFLRFAERMWDAL